MRSDICLRRVAAAGLLAAATLTIAAADGQRAPRFRPDDPIGVDSDRAVDASGVRPARLGAYADFVLNTFFRPGDARPIRALNVNTVDEVPDSSWFTNRAGARPLSLTEIVRGPDRADRLDASGWIIVEGKDTGRQAGFRAVRADDPGGDLFQIEFDPAANPEMATSAEIIGTAIYHALGYHVVDTYLIDLDPATVTIAPDATISDGGAARRFTRRDLAALLRGAARRPDGRYRATASRFAEGRDVGPFRYYGTRPDDPNDIYPHEHRRELRANRVFAAWINHDDSRAGNTLDMLVGRPGTQHVKHYMFDFGSTLGSGTSDADHPWVGHEYVVQARPALLTLASFGMWRRPYLRVSAPDDLPATGGFTADGFDPAAWRPHYPNAAFDNLQPDDAFWAARRVAAISPEAIGAIVAKAQYSDPHVEDYVAGALVRRRAQILRTWLQAVAPIVDPRITADGELRVDNAAVAAGVAEPPDGYALTWFAYDNASGHRRVVAADRTPDGIAPVPAALTAGEAYIGVDIHLRGGAADGAWARVYFRAEGHGGWTTVGLERHAAPGTR